MNHVIPPGARSVAKKGVPVGENAYIQAAHYNEPETLHEQIDRERKVEQQKAKMQKIFNRLDINRDGTITYEEYQQYIMSVVSFFLASLTHRIEP